MSFKYGDKVKLNTLPQKKHFKHRDDLYEQVFTYIRTDKEYYINTPGDCSIVDCDGWKYSVLTKHLTKTNLYQTGGNL